MIELPENTAKWVASLSNGETIVEGTSKVEEIQGGLSSWQQLQKYMAANKLTITALQVKHGGRTFNLPSVTPKFGGAIPLGYHQGRWVAADANGPEDKFALAEKCIFIQAIYSGLKVTLFVDEMGYNQSWIKVEIS